MTLIELLAYFKQKGVLLWKEGSQLRYNAPSGVLEPQYLADLRDHKAALLEVLGPEQPRIEDAQFRSFPKPLGNCETAKLETDVAEEATLPADQYGAPDVIEGLLAPYADLIARAERSELLRGKTMHLSCWESANDLNIVVLAASQTFQSDYNAPGYQVRVVARAQTELLERCRLAQVNGGNAIRMTDKLSGAVAEA